jgi:hypothetical protein
MAAAPMLMAAGSSRGGDAQRSADVVEVVQAPRVGAQQAGAYLPYRGGHGQVAAGADQHRTCVIRPEQNRTIGDIGA